MRDLIYGAKIRQHLCMEYDWFGLLLKGVLYPRSKSTKPQLFRREPIIFFKVALARRLSHLLLEISVGGFIFGFNYVWGDIERYAMSKCVA